MRITQIDSRFSATVTVNPDEESLIAELGHRSILCAHPDGEGPGQPAFAEMGTAAQKADFPASCVAVTQPDLSDDQIKP